MGGKTAGRRSLAANGSQPNAATYPGDPWPSSTPPALMNSSPPSTAAHRHRGSTSKPTNQRDSAPGSPNRHSAPSPASTPPSDPLGGRLGQADKRARNTSPLRSTFSSSAALHSITPSSA